MQLISRVIRGRAPVTYFLRLCSGCRDVLVFPVLVLLLFSVLCDLTLEKTINDWKKRPTILLLKKNKNKKTRVWGGGEAYGGMGGGGGGIN